MSAVWATGGVGRPRAAAFLVLAGLSAAAYEERRAARSGAIAVRLVEREKVTERVRTQLREPTSAECVERVLAFPRACREVVNGLTAQAVRGHLDSGAHTATIAAIERLVQALINSGIRSIR